MISIKKFFIILLGLSFLFAPLDFSLLNFTKLNFTQAETEITQDKLGMKFKSWREMVDDFASKL